jgi:hypothetical protein
MPCARCGGSGREYWTNYNGIEYDQPCRECLGTGKSREAGFRSFRGFMVFVLFLAVVGAVLWFLSR